MSIGRVRYKLNKSTSKVASNSDGYFNLNLESQLKLLPPGEINRLVNVGDIFNSERESVTKYRVISTISPIFSNVLFNMSGDKGPNEYNSQNGINYSDSYGYQTFDGFLFRNKPYPNDFTGTAPLNYLQSLSENLKEINGWFGFYDPDVTKSGFCGFYDLEPTRNRFDLNSSLNTKNWEITITYPYSKDENHYLVNGGLLVTSAEIRIMGGVPMVAIGSVVPHNLNQGDRVRLTNMPTNSMNGDYVVIALGLDNGDSKDTFFVVEIDPTIAITGSLFTTGRMKRLYFGNEVTYYFRKFKKINSFETKSELTKDSYECYPLAFSQTIYGDQNHQLVFNDDIDIEGLVDNLGRPLSEVYITLIKTDSENTFTKVVSGLDLENYQGNTKTVTTDDLKVSNIRKMHTISPPLSTFNSHIPLESDVRFNNIDYYGDLCEYSKLEVKETILKNVMHRFNTIDREITQLKPIGNVNVDINPTVNKIYNNIFNYEAGQAPTLAAFETQIGFPLINGAKFADTIVFDNVGYTVGDFVFQDSGLTGYLKCSANETGVASFLENSITHIQCLAEIIGIGSFLDNSITHVYLPNNLSVGGTGAADGCFQSNNIQYLNTPIIQHFGATTGLNDVFNGNTGNNITVIAPSIHQTSNGGGLEGDLAYLQANNTVTFDWDGQEVPEWVINEPKYPTINNNFGNIEFNSIISGPRNEGYIYQPHHQLKIRNYSNYIEQGDNTTAGIPDYSENLGDGRYIWRDLLPIGDNDGQDDTLDYPFVNGSHHLYSNLCFTTKRQDPFGLFGLQYNTTDIPDPFGFGITDNFQIKDTDDVC
jgi:hypothetical protein